MANLIETIEYDIEAELEEEGEGTPADWVNLVPQGQWTYEAYLKIPNDGNRYEIIDGVLYLMASPNHKHQTAVRKIAHYFTTYVDLAGLGEVLLSPFDITLPSGSTVQPDVSVVLKQNKRIVKAKRAYGTPDLVVEVASPSTGGYDQKLKKASYAQAGVKEYWIVRPSRKTVEISTLEEGELVSKGIFKGQDTLPTQIIPEFPVKVEQFFV
jgi:Uma2 family endonuclease